VNTLNGRALIKGSQMYRTLPAPRSTDYSFSFTSLFLIHTPAPVLVLKHIPLESTHALKNKWVSQQCMHCRHYTDH